MLENLFVFSTGLIGLLAIAQIFIRFKSNYIANVYLILILSIIVVRFLVIGFLSLFNPLYLNIILNNYNNVLIIVVPLTFLYFNNLVTNRKKIITSDAYHMVIPLAFIIIDFLDDHQLLAIPFKNRIFLSFFLIYIVFYIVYNYEILRRGVWSKSSPISFINKQNKIIKKWTIFLFSLLFLMGLRLMISLFLEVTNNHYEYGRSFIWISCSIWLFIFLRILIFPEVLKGYLYHKVDISSSEKVITISTMWKRDEGFVITNVQDLKLQKKIINLLEGYKDTLDDVKKHSKLFRDAKISLGDLAYKLDIPKSHLTFLFKYYSEISFSDFKKAVRIEDALGLIDEGYLSHNTFDSLARLVGFASYNPFYTSFREIVGVTPQDYYNNYEHYRVHYQIRSFRDNLSIT